MCHQSSERKETFHSTTFSEQLAPQGDGRAVIASFVLTSDDGGVAIDDLWRLIDADRQVTPEQRQKVAAVIAATLGDSWRRLRALAFDAGAARMSLRLYRSQDIPTVEGVPDEVRDVRFSSDLTNAPDVSLAQLRTEGSLFQTIL